HPGRVRDHPRGRSCSLKSCQLTSQPKWGQTPVIPQCQRGDISFHHGTSLSEQPALRGRLVCGRLGGRGMPYILADDRTRLDVHIQTLAREIDAIASDHKAKAEKDGKSYDGAFAGLLNYACTRLALELVPERRYWTIA